MTGRACAAKASFSSITSRSLGLMRMAVSTLRIDRKSTRLNSSHSHISYAGFCLKKKSYWPTARNLRTQLHVPVRGDRLQELVAVYPKEELPAILRSQHVRHDGRIEDLQSVSSVL